MTRKILLSLCVAAVGNMVLLGASYADMVATGDAVDSWFTDNGYRVFADADGIERGWGGQAYDAEYLLYKTEGTKISIGLQTGFDIVDGYYRGVRDGDIFLTINGVNYGLWTQSQPDVYMDKLHPLTTVNSVEFQGTGNHVPFEYIWDGTPEELIADAYKAQGNALNSRSYVGGFTFDMTSLSDFADYTVADALDISVQWTMSCGNDYIGGSFQVPAAPVPEPASTLLFGAGVLGFAGVIRRRRQG